MTMTDTRPDILHHLRHATLGAQTADDIAWAQLHYYLFIKGWATNGPSNAETRALLYRAFAEQHPALAGLALQTAEQWGG